MADIADIANDYAELYLEHSLAKHAGRTKSEESAFYCIECDEAIPHKRRAAIQGVKTCVDCQSRIERGLL